MGCSARLPVGCAYRSERKRDAPVDIFVKITQILEQSSSSLIFKLIIFGSSRMDLALPLPNLCPACFCTAAGRGNNWLHLYPATIFVRNNLLYLNNNTEEHCHYSGNKCIYIDKYTCCQGLHMSVVALHEMDFQILLGTGWGMGSIGNSCMAERRHVICKILKRLSAIYFTCYW